MSVAFYTLGCKLNQAETGELKDKLIKRKIKVVPFKKKADFYIVNACSVTAKAEKETRQVIRQIKREFPKTFLIVIGCWTQQMKRNKEIAEKVDKWIGNDRKMDVDKLILRLNKNILPNSYNLKTEKRTRAFIRIQSGCQHYCSYCIVPYLRNNLFNKPVPKIINEIKRKEKNGFKEVVLVGTNISEYYYNGNKLTDLLKEILNKTNIPRIRISSLWPTSVKDSLLKIIKNNSRICRHIHLSIQSGADRILKKMNRNYTRKELDDIFKKLSRINNLNLSADIIVGFPGEKNADFIKTYNLIESYPFLKIHIFRFSSRPGTEASRMSDKVSEIVKKKRFHKIDELTKKINKKIRNKYIGKSFSILFESKKVDLWSGYSKNYLRVYVKSKNNLNNKIVRVKLQRLYKDGLIGKIRR